MSLERSRLLPFLPQELERDLTLESGATDFVSQLGGLDAGNLAWKTPIIARLPRCRRRVRQVEDGYRTFVDPRQGSQLRHRWT
jgi:hypothetical protein